MNTEKMPSQEYLNELLRYEHRTGKLYWRERTPKLFKEGKRTAEWTAKWWNNRFANKEAGALTPKGFVHLKIEGNFFPANRLIWKMFNGTEPDVVKHKNGVRHDNKLENLLPTTFLDRQSQLAKYSNNKSGFKGVSWHKHSCKWHARIKVKGKIIDLGLFTELDDAIGARRVANKKYGFSEAPCK